MSILLNLIYALLLVAVSPWIVWRRVTQGRYRRGWGAKLLGMVEVPSRTKDIDQVVIHEKPVVWFHAVSVGELQVVRPLIETFERERPDVTLVVTTSTDSGYELAKKMYARHCVSFAPLDFTWAVRTAIQRISPSLIVLAELELWPNWISAASAKDIPVVVVNARLSSRSLSGYQRVRWLIQPVLRQLRWVGAQSATYRERFIQLGCDPTRVVETGNTKFDGATGDREDPEVLRRREELNLRPDDVVWLCGSTQSPEEKLCLDAYRRLGPQYPHLKLILVPRHAERFDEVANEVAGTKLPWLRRSEMSVKAKGDGSSDAWKTEDWKIFLADSVGELRWWWGLADIGFVGGSFGSRGGQNMIEPCAYGVATSFGPNTRNFADVVQLLLEGGAAVQLVEPPSLETWVRQMVEHPSERQEITAKARQVTSEHRGAIDRTWKALSVLLPASKLPNRSPNG
jgi:3-deoxy-D-manno-octulosonic-acid transferase